MVTLWLDKFNAGHLVVMTLKCFVTLEFLFLIEFPKLNGHVSGAWGHVLSIWIEADVVDHASMLSQCLFHVASLVVPNFNRSIFTRTCKLIVHWMEYTPRHSRSVAHHLQLLWFSWNCITCTLFEIFVTELSTWLAYYRSIFSEFPLHILHINLVLLINLLQLFVIFFNIQQLLLQTRYWRPLPLQNVF